MSKIAVRCKVSHAEGMGHLIRQLRLGKVLREKGLEVNFFLPDHPPSIELLKRENFPYRIVPPHECLPETPDPYDLLILDLNDTNKGFIDSARQQARKIVSFENLGEGRNHVDLLIDCNLDEKDAKEVGEGVETLFGFAWSLLDPEFEKYHNQSREFSDSVGPVLITMGGTDPNNLTYRLAKDLIEARKDISLTLLAGPGFQNHEEIGTLASGSDSVTVSPPVSNMAKILFEHQAVFCSGGVTLHEAMATGTPAFVINQAQHQNDKAQTVEASGAAKNLGLAEDYRKEKLTRFLEINKSQLGAMSRAGSSLVDGRGVHRIADAVHQLVLSQ